MWQCCECQQVVDCRLVAVQPNQTLEHVLSVSECVARGENRLAGWEYRPVANSANRCLLRMIVSTDIRVSRAYFSADNSTLT